MLAASRVHPRAGSRRALVLLDNSGDGTHTMEGSKPFGVSVCGYGQFTSYWYPGGLDLKPLTVE